MKAKNRKQEHDSYASNKHAPPGLQMPSTASLLFFSDKKATKALELDFKQQTSKHQDGIKMKNIF